MNAAHLAPANVPAPASPMAHVPLPDHFPLPDRDAIEAAAEVLRALVPPTPQYLWPQVAQAFGANVWIKHENHTPIGAFKARSAAIYFHKLMQQLPESQPLAEA